MEVVWNSCERELVGMKCVYENCSKEFIWKLSKAYKQPFAERIGILELTKSSYKTELGKMTSHLELLTWKFL